MSQTRTLKIRVTLFCILVGIVLAMVAVVTDHWAVLSPHMEHHNATCEAAHFGLWRICTKSIAMSDSKDMTCGPITLPGGNVASPCPPSPCPCFRPFPIPLAKWSGAGFPASERPSMCREVVPAATARL